MNWKFIVSLGILAYFLTLLTSNAQAPDVAWRSIDWPPFGWSGAVNQGQTGEDWWYNHTNSYDVNGNLNGYLAVGYHTRAVTNTASLNAHNNFFAQGCEFSGITDFGTGTGDWDAFETSTRRKGHQFGNIAFFDLEGNMLWCFPFNTLDFQDAIQIEPGGDFICVGSHTRIQNVQGTGVVGFNPTSSGSLYFDNDCDPDNDNDTDMFEAKMYACRVTPSGQLVWE